MDIFSIGPKGTIHIFGIRLVGFTFENGVKLLLTIVFFAILWALSKLAKKLIRRSLHSRTDVSAEFWSNQAVKVFVAFLMIIIFVSIWFDNPVRLTTALGLVTAGLAFALQKAVTSVAGYFVILKGRLFNVGDRIAMAGVRGDVIKLSFIYTRVMEMGQPPAVQMADPAMWIEARQYTGRIVTITNDKVFDTPLYNYSREFPFIWDEMHLFIDYQTDYVLAEKIIVETVSKNTTDINKIGRENLDELERRYMVHTENFEPKVYYRLTDNWLDMGVRFLSYTINIREMKDKIARGILEEFQKEGIKIASSSFNVVGVPPLKIKLESNK